MRTISWRALSKGSALRYDRSEVIASRQLAHDVIAQFHMGSHLRPFRVVEPFLFEQDMVGNANFPDVVE